MGRSILCVGVLGAALTVWRVSAADPVSNLRSDEVIEFFPTYCRYDPAEREQAVTINAWVYEPATNSTTARLFWSALGIDAEQAKDRIFQERANRFFVDSERGKRIVVRLGGKNRALSPTEANGHAETHFAGVSLDAKTSTLDYEAVLQNRDNRKFAGRVHLIPPTGVSVISDIDDTIKVSQVRDKRALLNNTFFKEFEPVRGMEKVYQAWAKEGAVFHYVTASPWQLFAPLESFREKAGFPAGTFHMKQFRLKDSSAWSLFESPTDYKPKVIEPILRDFPKRRFVLVGDSGEKDPEVYGGLARKFAEQIAKILIRDVTDEPAEAARYAEAFKDVPRQRWTIFKRTDEIAGYRP